MRPFIYFIILSCIVSCTSRSENYYSNTDVIEISNYSIPDSAKVLDSLQISVSAEEPNGCWGGLNFVLDKSSFFLYRLKAFGTFVNNGRICPDGIVKKDTLIFFSPTDTGTYLFYVYKTPAIVIVDTLRVKR